MLFAYAKTLRGNQAADKLLCFCYIDTSLNFLNSKFQASSVAMKPGLYQTWLENPKTGFLMMELNWDRIIIIIFLVSCVFCLFF